MKKKGWLFALPVVLLAVILALFLREQEQGDAPTLELSASLSELTLCVSDGSGETEELSCWIDGESGEGYFFLPSYASIETAELLRGGTAEEGLTLAGVESGDRVAVDDGVFTVLQGSALPAVYIETESGSLAAIQADKDHKESGDIRIVNADGSLHYAGLLKHIKGRGNTSWEHDKKPYNIKLQEKADLFGMGAAKSWCLLANYRDTSYVRNAMVYDYARAMGMENVTGTQSFDLYVNGEYQGLYLMTEKVEVGGNRVDIPDLDEENERKNPQKKPEEYPVFSTGTEKGVSLPYTPQEAEGYLMELDFPGRWEEEVSGFVTEAGQHVVLKNPEYASEAQVAYAKELVQTFESRLFSGDPAYLDCIDLNSWVQLYLIEEIFEDVDCGLSSIYFYIRDGKLTAGPLWDFDLTMGASYAVTNPRTLYAAWSERTERFTSYYLPALYADATFRAAVEETFRGGWQQGLSALAARAQSYVDAVTASARMDALRWGRDHQATLDSGAYLANYLTERCDFLTSLWLEGESYHRVRVMGGVQTRYYEYMVRDGECMDSFPTLYRDGYTLEGWDIEETGEAFDPATPVTEELHLIARWKQNS